MQDKRQRSSSFTVYKENQERLREAAGVRGGGDCEARSAPRGG